MCDSPSFYIKSNIYKHWSQLEIERSNLYLELWAKWPKKETYFSLIYVISDTCWFHCLNHKAGPNQTDLISEQVQAGIWEERRGERMTWQHSPCAGAKSQLSVLSLASFISADTHVFDDCLILGLCNAVHTVAKRVSPGKTICEGKIWFPVCRILSVFVFSFFFFSIMKEYKEK